MFKSPIIYISLILVFVSGCSRTTLNMKNNNWSNRTYHNTTSRYNIYFNGNEALTEAIEAIESANINDYTQVLPVFEDGMHENYATVSGDMEYAIEKGNKIIQLHSIKKKPKFNPKKASDPKYRAWRNQEEFNKMIDDAYMLMGKATFYKGEFLEAIGIFSHVAFKYEGEDAWYLAHLWMARAYLEMDWLYEAENMLTLANDENLPFQLVKFFNIVSADYHIKKGEYKEAVPFLKSALEERFKRSKRQRYRFILAQIYQEIGEDELAYEYYKRVVRSIPDYEMEFFTRIRMTEVMMGDDTRRAIKKLNRMLKDPKNLPYKGQIYYALGNIYTKTGESTLAIENYRLSLEFSDGLQKGVTANTIAELYYEDKDYREAGPYYTMASQGLPDDYPNIYEINFRSEVLGELNSYYDIVGDVDREYQLSQMTSTEKEDFLRQEEKDLKREEKIQELIAEARGDNEKELALEESTTQEVGDWYFFNPSLVETGKEEFYARWGDRSLKDNWRRSMALDFSDEQTFEEEEEEYNDEYSEDSISIADTLVVDSTSLAADALQDFISSDQAIIRAYFNLAALYQYDIEDYPKAIETYEALEAQYPNSRYSPDSYFAIYNAATAIENNKKAEEAKETLLSYYPNSNYALILSDPNAKEVLLQDSKDYNALYEETFGLFMKGENYKVLKNTKRLRNDFRDSSLVAKVLFMESLSTAKTDSRADIKPQLEQIIANYPQDTTVVEQAGIVLSQLEDGKKINRGGSAANTLSERRNESAEIERKKILSEQKFKAEPDARHYMVFVLVDSLHVNRNHLQFDVSKFNFKKFMTMDFDLSFGKLNQDLSLMVINGFSNEEEGRWYIRELLASNTMENYTTIQKMYIISEENFRLLQLLATLEEYEAFERRR